MAFLIFVCYTGYMSEQETPKGKKTTKVKEVVEAPTEPQKVLMFFKWGVAYYLDDLVFTQEHPFQLVDPGRVDHLVETGQFRRATPEEVVTHYQLGV